MRSSQKNKLNTETMDHLLSLRQKNRPSQTPCPETETLALVLEGLANSKEINLAASHLETCRLCSETVDKISEQLRLDPQTVARAQPMARFRYLLVPAGLLTVLLVCFFVFYRLQSTTSEEKSDFLIKGTDAIHLAVQRGMQRFQARPGDALQPGDRLGFFYTAPRKGFLALIDLKASGKASVLYPSGKTHSKRIEKGVQQPLPDGAVVTKSAGCEWLVAVFSDQSIPLQLLTKHLLEAVKKPGKNCRLIVSMPEARSVWTFRLPWE